MKRMVLTDKCLAVRGDGWRGKPTFLANQDEATGLKRNSVSDWIFEINASGIKMLEMYVNVHFFIGGNAPW